MTFAFSRKQTLIASTAAGVIIVSGVLGVLFWYGTTQTTGIEPNSIGRVIYNFTKEDLQPSKDYNVDSISDYNMKVKYTSSWQKSDDKEDSYTSFSFNSNNNRKALVTGGKVSYDKITLDGVKEGQSRQDYINSLSTDDYKKVIKSLAATNIEFVDQNDISLITNASRKNIDFAIKFGNDGDKNKTSVNYAFFNKNRERVYVVYFVDEKDAQNTIRLQID